MAPFMRDLTNPKTLWAKGVLFLLVGIAASIVLWMEAPTLQAAVLITITIWAFCRAYYFAFYVIERYVDPGYKFAGLGSFILYSLRRRGRRTSERNLPQ